MQHGEDAGGYGNLQRVRERGMPVRADNGSKQEHREAPEKHHHGIAKADEEESR